MIESTSRYACLLFAAGALHACSVTHPVDEGGGPLGSEPARAAAPGTDRAAAGPEPAAVPAGQDDAADEPRPPSTPEARPAVSAGRPIENGACANGCDVAVGKPSTPLGDGSPGSILCKAAFPWQPQAWLDSFALASDGHGNVYYVARFADGADVGFGPMVSGQGSSFIVKVDAGCSPVWIKQLSGTRFASVGLSDLAGDAGGDLVVVGTMNGTLDFGAGELSSMRPDGENQAIGVVLKLDRDGNVLWNRALVSTFTATWVTHVAISGADDIVVTGRGGTDVHFEGGPTPEQPERAGVFIARLSASGEPRSVDQIGAVDVSAGIGVDPSGRIAVAGWAFGARGTGSLAGFETSQTQYERYVLMLDAQGTVLWDRRFDPFGDSEWSGLIGGGMALDSAGNVLISSGVTTVVDGGSFALDPEWIRKIDPGGAELWMQTSVFAGPSEIDWMGRIAVDSHDASVHVDALVSGNTVDGESFDVIGPQDLLVRKRGADGEVLWSTQLGGDGEEVIWGLTTDPSDAVWIGYEAEGEDYSSGTATIVKLAP